MSVTAHYETLLADHYSWMLGPFDERVADQRTLLAGLGITGPGRALDLGCGAGIQSVALAEFGFQVTAVDTSRKLLAELETRKGTLPIATVMGDIAALPAGVDGDFDLAVCMGDTLTHLPDPTAVECLIDGVACRLKPGGRFILTFRDLTGTLHGTDRFIPVRGDDDRLMTCFLEYEADTVVVHDLIHLREDGAWVLHMSSYRKLRLAPDRVRDGLSRRGFAVSPAQSAGRLTLIAATR